MKNAKEKSNKAVAIIGIGCMLPGGSDFPTGLNHPEKFAEMLRKKFDAIRDIPEDRWDNSLLYHPDFNRKGRINVKQGGFIDGWDEFDAAFFGISPVDAVRIDPQQRKLLENAYYAIEDAGLTMDELSDSRSGVFIGISSHDYGDIHLSPSERVNIGSHSMQGNAISIASNRISYFFNLKGPSFSVDTACSSSLIALHLAYKSILNGECELAFVGGVNAIFKPDSKMGFSKGGFLANDARCKTFDAKANGYVRSEGSGIIIIKPYDKAKKDGDKIYALIIGSAINQDGRTTGLAMPSLTSQVKVLQDAYKDAGIDPKSVSYIEAHGTGTAVGDQTETNSVGEMFGKERSSDNPLWIGSVKSNIGHLEPASGIAGIIKLAMMMKHKEIFPNIHFETPNPNIRFDEWNLKIPTECVRFPENNGVIYSGINSFGFGGSNAHIVLQSDPGIKKENKKDTEAEENLPCLFTISARSNEALKDYANKYIDYLKYNEASIYEICRSASLHKSAFENRLVTAVNSKDELEDALRSFINEEPRDNVLSGMAQYKKDEKIVFVYSGQGGQWWKMGKELLNSQPLFSKCIKSVDTILKDLGWLKNKDCSLIEELNKIEKESRMSETKIAQPAIFATQIALTELWKEYGIKPDAVIGHSIGEIAAAWAAGILSFEDATKVICWRGQFQSKLKGKGKMLAAAISEEAAEEYLRKFKGLISMGAVNSANMVTLSGDEEALIRISAELDGKDIFNRFLPVNIPFHSHFIEVLKDDFINSLGELTSNEPKIPIYSTVTGDKIVSMDSLYLYRNARETVHFHKTLTKILDDGFKVFIEISPHPILSRSVRETFNEKGVNGLIVPSLKRGEEEKKRLILSLGELFANGYEIAWEKLFNKNAKRINLPFYPWQKERYWLETKETENARKGFRFHTHLKNKNAMAKETDSHIWEVCLDKRLHPYIEDHRVQGPLVYPGAGHCELAISAALITFGKKFGFLEDINFKTALFLPDNGEPPYIQLEIISDEGNYFIATKNKEPDAEWKVHSNGKMNVLNDEFFPEYIDIEEKKKTITETVDLEILYSELFDGGLQLGESFRGIKNLYRNDFESLAEVHVKDSLKDEYLDFNTHPAVLDTCFQSAFGILKKLGKGKMGVYIPVHIDRFKFYQKQTTQVVWAYARKITYGEKYIKANIWIYDDSNNIIAEIQGFTAQYLKGSKGEVDNERKDHLYRYNWIPKLRKADERDRHPERFILSQISIKDDIRTQMAKLNEGDLSNKFFNELYIDLSVITQGYVINALQGIGFFKDKAAISVDEILKRYSIDKKHKRLIHQILKLIEPTGCVQFVGNKWRVIDNPPEINTKKMMDNMVDNYKEFEPEITLIRRCGPFLKEVFQSQVSPLDLIFPEDEFDSVFEYYAMSYSFRRCNDTIAFALQRMLSSLPENQTLKILEIGAGTGGLSQALFPILPQDRTEYFFTDISPMFLAKAKERFSDYPFIKYSLLDIEKDFNRQGFLEHEFDIIIASDVIHATSDVKKTLSTVQRLLASKGLFVMLEIVQAPIYLDIIFGMLDGWWMYNDEIRKDHCTLNEEAWQDVLQDVGFGDIFCISDVPIPDNPGQAVFFANNKEFEKTEEVSNLQQAIRDKENRQGYWLIFADSSGVTEKIIGQFKDVNKDYYLIYKGDEFLEDDNKFIINPGSEEDLEQVIYNIIHNEKAFQGILYLWPISKNRGNISNEILEDTINQNCMGLVNIVKVMNTIELDNMPELWVVTNGAEIINQENKNISLEGSPIIGLSRTIATEHPGFKTTIIDLGKEIQDEEIKNLYKELWVDKSEENTDELAFRGSRRYVRRYDCLSNHLYYKVIKKSVPPLGYNYSLVNKDYGNLDFLALVEAEEKSIEKDEVKVKVHAASLNFRDLMLALGKLPEEAFQGGLFEKRLGLECAGEVIEIGDSVNNIKVGDRVMLLSSGCISGIVITKEYYVSRFPSYLTFEQASSIPLVFLTVYHSLVYLARISKSDKVLIHAAAGGIGTAAIKLAQYIGAEVFATCSTVEKRDFLKSLEVQHIMDSRSLNFRNQIMDLTDGKGVDIVLNSIAGSAITQSLKCLAPYGKFLEIGKADIYNNSRIGLKLLRENISYHVVDIDKLLKQKPELISTQLMEITELFNQKHITPVPIHDFEINDYLNAFRFFSQSKHFGKVVLSFKGSNVEIECDQNISLDKESTYLVFGGTGGFGLSIGLWLAGKGAKNIVFASRSGIKSEDAQRAIDGMRENGINILVKKADIADYNQVDNLIKEINGPTNSLKGVINSTMVLDDSMLINMDPKRFMNAIRPKVIGTLNLHKSTENIELDHFIMFSSISSIFGVPGQSNYAAANSFLDAFCHYRGANGLPATTINWGVIGDVGYVSKAEKVQKILSSQGWNQIPIKKVLQILEKIFMSKDTQVSVIDVEWDKVTNFFPHIKRSVKFKHILEDSHSKFNETEMDLRGAIRSASDNKEKYIILEDSLKKALASILGSSSEKIPSDISILNMGIDSLMSGQIRVWINNALNIDFSLMQIMKGPSLRELIYQILKELDEQPR